MGVSANQNEQKETLKGKFGTITNNDLRIVENKQDELLGKLKTQLGKTEEELHIIIVAIAIRQYFHI